MNDLNSNGTSIQKQKRLKLFISHSNRDKNEVEELASCFSSWGIDCFIAHRDIEPTEDWVEKIKKELREADVFLTYMTDNFLDSKWAVMEAGFAAINETPIITLKISKSAPPAFLGRRQALSVKNGYRPDEVTFNMLKIILKEFDDEGLVKKKIISLFSNSPFWTIEGLLFELLEESPNFTNTEIDQLVKGYNENTQQHRNFATHHKILDFLHTRSDNIYELERYKIKKSRQENNNINETLDEEVPW